MVEETVRRSRTHAALRTRSNWVQLGKFCAVGGIGYVINLAVYTALLHAGLHYIVAAICSFVVACTSNYFLNRHWTFHDRRGHVGVQGLQFLVVSAASLGANLLVLHVLVKLGLDDHKTVAQAIAIVVVTPLNFLGNRLWSFRHRKA
jgi:putative flippase GtrA